MCDKTSPQVRLSPAKSSVRYGDTTRFDKSKEQAALKTKNIDTIIGLVNELFREENIGT